MKQCYWNLAEMLHPTKYTRWYSSQKKQDERGNLLLYNNVTTEVLIGIS